MKHFKLIGPQSTREFDIEDDEMVVSYIIKIAKFDSPHRQKIETDAETINEQNIKIYDTKNSDV